MKSQQESLSIRNVSKTYTNGVQALNSISLSIPKGMYGLLGPNGAGPRAEGESSAKVLYLQKHQLGSGKQKIMVTVPSKPSSAGIAPNYLLIDLDMEDNMKKVK